MTEATEGPPLPQRGAMSLIPLFPLNLVLLPGALLPLHIFEERYQDMVGKCLAEECEFGVTWEQEIETPETEEEESEATAEEGETPPKGKGWSRIGCSARIVRVLNRYPDGRMDILARGERRFSIEAVDLETHEYAQAEVGYFDDDPVAEDPIPQSERELLLEMHRRVLILQGQTMEPPDEGADLGFALCQGLEQHWGLKQQILALRSPAARVRYLIAYYERLLPLLEEAQQIRRKVASNGHLRNKSRLAG